ncbi:MAG TPA: class I SAM-dependent methyltransferase, partial [Planctomycetaceae bacterium]|nr:class I SAM-dependent methyltransferase [Planctomycetaceae bacterium]
MTDRSNRPAPDEWSQWLLHRRHSDDPAYERRVRAVIERYRDRVLDGAELQADCTLADIGAGDGLIAFGAIDRMGPSLRVILTDISEPLLAHATQLAEQWGVRSQCSFVRCGAD